jgi:hypothetical protein
LAVGLFSGKLLKFNELRNIKRFLLAIDETREKELAALDEASERLRQSGSPLARPAYSRVMREVVAKRIIELAQRGVQDRETLVEDAVRFVTANYERPSD